MEKLDEFLRSNRYPAIKYPLKFLLGFLLGLVFYRYILLDLSFSEEISFWLAVTVCISLGLGIAISSQIRCIAMLAIPSFGGKIGRSVLKALVIAFVISGPIENLSNNGREVVRVFACTASLTFNITKSRFSLMFKPFSDAIFGMKAEINEVKDTIRSIKDVSAPVIGEVEDEEAMRKVKEENDYLNEDAEQTTNSSDAAELKADDKSLKLEAAAFEKHYLKKVETRCMDQFAKASVKCRGMFEKGYDTCYETVTWVAAWLLCWPMKLDFVCNIGEALGGTGRCDPSKHIDPGFGEGYAYLKRSRQSLTQNFKNVKLQYKIGKLKQLKDIRDARDTATAILHKIKTKKSIFTALMGIIKRILALVFLRILLNCQTYEEKYLKDIEFDNIYITKYFRKIDARRKASDKPTLLPLKKIERQQLVDPLTFKPLKFERENIIRESILLTIEMITASTFVLLDVLFFEALDIIRRHAKIDYLTTGKHDIMLQIKGTGMIAALLRSLVKGFNVKKRIKIERSNEKCLPNPTSVVKSYVLKIYGTYLAIWTMMWLQAYSQRLRRLICSYFFRKREKKRVLFLYNETLKKRKARFRYMRKTVERKAREERLKENYNVLQVLTIKYPARFGWLRKVFRMARRSCLVCEDPEPKTASDFIECPNEGCHFLYCPECWTDMGDRCLVCAVEDALDFGTTDDDSADDYEPIQF